MAHKRGILPGFSINLGFTVLYLSLIVLIPLSATFFKASSLGWLGFWHVITETRVLASYKLTFGASLAAAGLNAVFGLLVAWVLVRYQFFGKKLIDSLVDLPFALPTAVAGISLATLYSSKGWIGSYLVPLGIKVASLGASRWQTFRYVIFPALFPALITGFALAFARAIGEYGSVIFIAGNIPMVSEITPLLIITKLEQYDYPGATALAVSMLMVSFVLLLGINALQRWSEIRKV